MGLITDVTFESLIPLYSSILKLFPSASLYSFICAEAKLASLTNASIIAFKVLFKSKLCRIDFVISCAVLSCVVCSCKSFLILPVYCNYLVVLHAIRLNQQILS